ncbi:ABC transporter ATP-binding protein [Paenibacillus peoriae]|uniref:energy-coupling factor ABC transporter ATP-binding protein n=1 Tax=Paenibacillus peoriae TaxID=59893 RepID=UPI00026C59E1|nr:ABC transporter ATP-binding protein [Paenibacillus peoriae]MEC0182168.1 ABC transporter ATP-binding protein [Paenibacillus peoriae]
MSLLSMENVSYRYPINDWTSLKQVTLNIEAGVFYAVIGANGAGKTTLCSVLRGFIPHFYNGELEGEVKLFGKNLLEYELGDIASRIGYLFQNPFTQISGAKETVFEEIAYGLENLGMEPAEIRKKVEDVIALLKLEKIAESNPTELSGGQKQRVAFAAVIVMDPEVLIIDEPTSQLDPQGTEEIFRIIDLMKQRGKTIILVEHKMEWIAEYADQIIVMEDGQVVMQGDTQSILSNPKVMEHGGSLPQYAEVGLKLLGEELVNQVPITRKQAELVFSKLKKGGAE